VSALIPRAELVADRISTASGRYRSFIDRAYRLAHPFGFRNGFELHGYWAIEVKAGVLASILDALICAVRSQRVERFWCNELRAWADTEAHVRRVFRFPPPETCSECGRWGYHLVSCSRGPHGGHRG
jgi:hypothetical protein